MNRKGTKNNKYPFKGGQKGYARIAEKFAAESGDDRRPPHHELWSVARENKDSSYDDPQVKEIVNKIVSINISL